MGFLDTASLHASTMPMFQKEMYPSTLNGFSWYCFATCKYHAYISKRNVPLYTQWVFLILLRYTQVPCLYFKKKCTPLHSMAFLDTASLHASTMPIFQKEMYPSTLNGFSWYCFGTCKYHAYISKRNVPLYTQWVFLILLRYTQVPCLYFKKKCTPLHSMGFLDTAPVHASTMPIFQKEMYPSTLNGFSWYCFGTCKYHAYISKRNVPLYTQWIFLILLRYMQVPCLYFKKKCTTLHSMDFLDTASVHASTMPIFQKEMYPSTLNGFSWYCFATRKYHAYISKRNVPLYTQWVFLILLRYTQVPCLYFKEKYTPLHSMGFLDTASVHASTMPIFQKEMYPSTLNGCS